MNDFPHLDGATPFPGINTNVYKYKNNFDYTRWEPGNTKVKLLAVPWDGDDSNVVYFEGGEEERDAWFDAAPGRVVELDQMRRVAPDSTVKVPLPFDECAGFNYVWVVFTAPTSEAQPLNYVTGDSVRKYGFFIDDFDYKAASSTTLTLTMDVWTTYVYRCEVDYMMLSRGHAPMAAVSVDEYLSDPVNNSEYLLTDDVSYGEPAAKAASAWFVPFGAGEKLVLFATSMSAAQISGAGTVTPPSGKNTTPSFYTDDGRNGFLRGVNPDSYQWAAIGQYRAAVCEAANKVYGNHVFAVRGTDAFDGGFFGKMRELIPQAFQQIVATYVVDTSMALLGSAHTCAAGTFYEVAPNNGTLYNVELKKSDFDIPEKYADVAKLYTYPYSAIEVIDASGKKATVRVENTSAMKVCQKVSLIYPYLDMSAFVSGVNGSGDAEFEWRDLNGDASTASVPNGNFRDLMFKYEIPTFSLYTTAKEQHQLHNYNTASNQRANAILEYYKRMSAVNNATENTKDSNKTSYDNSLASNDTANTNALASNATANTNALASNATNNANALASNKTANDNALASNAAQNTNALASNKTANDNALASNETNKQISDNSADSAKYISELATGDGTTVNQGMNRTQLTLAQNYARDLYRVNSYSPTDTANGLNIQKILADRQIEIDYMQAMQKILEEQEEFLISQGTYSFGIGTAESTFEFLGGMATAYSAGASMAAAGISGLGAIGSGIVGNLMLNAQAGFAITKSAEQTRASQTKLINASETAANYANKSMSRQNEFNFDKLKNSNALTRSQMAKQNTTAKENAESHKSTADANANRTKETADSNANRVKETADANAGRTKATSDANADLAKTTGDANANRAKATGDANANRTKATGDANAANTKATADANAGYTQSTDQMNAATDMIIAQNNAAAAYANEGTKPNIAIGSFSGNASDDIERMRGLQIKVVTQLPGNLKQAGDQFMRYGYRLDRAWEGDNGRVKLNVMSLFSYWEASDVWMHGEQSVTEGAQEAIKGILKAGVTVWSDPAKIGCVSIYDNKAV